MPGCLEVVRGIECKGLPHHEALRAGEVLGLKAVEALLPPLARSLGEKGRRKARIPRNYRPLGQEIPAIQGS